MMSRIGRVVAALGVVVLAGCSSNENNNDAGTTEDAGITDGGGDAGGTDAGMDAGPADGGLADLCNHLPANNATTITDTVSNDAFPGASATGGIVESGTYFQTAHIYYQPATTPNHTWKGTLQIDAQNSTSLTNVDRDGVAFQQMAETFAVSGNQFTLTVVCPTAFAGTTATLTYTFDNGTLTIFSSSDQTATVFQKQ